MNNISANTQKNILVTGGAGYIGSHACKALALAGYTPIAYDNLVYGHQWAVKWGPLEIGDIADKNRLEKVFIKYRPMAVMHFAAYAYVGESIEKPLKYYRNNISGTLTLLEVMRRHSVDKLVFSSTCATYGVPAHLPITEDHPQKPINPYGISKLMVEQVLKDCGAAYGMCSISLRYFNAAGADPDGEIGEEHDPETHLIPLALDVAKGNRSHITILGNDYDTLDGTCVRDYIHVKDISAAHVLALEELMRSALKESNGNREAFTCKAYNLGNGQGFSVKNVIHAAEQVTGKNIPIKIGERRKGDPPVLIGDSKKIRNEQGWCPKFAALENIIETAWRWIY